ncbi:MAG: Segregation and condensation protein A [Anaerolineae bacterium]|nr:Segregation and condensation protein A [Anaerolineae bacterium]
MSFIIEEEQNNYEVDLPAFQGPLDLLLSLIEQEELDITKISLARVTDQYLSRLEIIKDTDPDDLTDFLVIAAKLILIKSEVLLPRPPPILAADDEEDVGDELARQLLIYKHFKEIAAQLRDVEEQHRRSYVRVVPKIKIEPKLAPGEGDLLQLLEAARNALAIKPEDPDVDEVVSPVSVTIGQQMVNIWREVASGRRVSFNAMLRQSSNKIEVIVTLLAVLELIKRRVITVSQSNRFGDILIDRKEASSTLNDADWESVLEMTEVS